MIQAVRPAPGDLLANQDVLSCGPLQPFDSLESWRDRREAYWRTVYGEDFSFEPEIERDLLTHVNTLRDASSITLWIGLGPAEQLLLPWMIHVLGILGIDPGILRVIQFVRSTKRSAEIWGLGVLNPEQLRNHPPPIGLSADAVSELHEAWAAVTSSAPGPLLALASTESIHLPYFGRSLVALLDRFPDERAGLSQAELDLLRYTKEKGPRATQVIGHTMGHNRSADLWGDAWLYSRLLRLADPSLPHPALTLSGDPTTMRTCGVALTDAGNEFLTGNANFVELNGIDDWVLGVHLQSSRGYVWYRTPDSLSRGSA